MALHDTEFISELEMDDNLLDNCYSMRERFCDEERVIVELERPISILEIMVYISVEIEDTIMTNEEFGDRTGLWFWGMIDSLGLIKYKNLVYYEPEVNDILENFIRHNYKKNGKGGLFTVKNRSNYDARNENIWSQAMLFLSDFAKKSGEIL